MCLRIVRRVSFLGDASTCILFTFSLIACTPSGIYLSQVFCTVPNLNQTSGVSYFCLMLESLYSRISRGGGDDLGIQNLSVLLVMALNSYSLGIHAISSLV